MGQAGGSVDPDGKQTLPHLVQTASLAISILLVWYRNLSLGWISLAWIFITLIYVVLAALVGFPTELAAVVGTIPTGMAIFSIRKYHEEKVF